MVLGISGEELKRRIEHSEAFDFEGLQVVVYERGKPLLNQKVGRTYAFYDVASLTKIFFTTLWFMFYHSNHDPRILHRQLKSLLPWYPHPRVKLGQLLNHSAGHPWWKPFYRKITPHLSPEQAYQQLEKFCQKLPLSPQKGVYSDIDFYLLGSVMQKLEAQPLREIWKKHKARFFSRSGFHFREQGVGGAYPGSLEKRLKDYAPTEKCSWRGKLLQGEVHDEHAWSLRGVAPHAGLFARIGDVAQYGLLLGQIRQGENPWVSSKTLEIFAQGRGLKAHGDWGFGFMKPSPKLSSAGKFFPKQAIGHTGFTGTSFWFDPLKDFFVGILSNRVHPSRKNQGFLQLRPQIHDWLLEKAHRKAQRKEERPKRREKRKQKDG